ncbi:hypothetical protein ACPRNU_12200 [Chromobacterium vaccinii]|uniref:hypothetical protein n=1 Tax=Chromobacterium vaccinii TaxID=1108595 RepID=UPI003C7330C8
MRNLLIALALASTSLPTLAACPAGAPGEPMHWVIAVCQQRNESDEIESPKMQSCIFAAAKANKIDPAKPSAKACSAKLKLKAEWCRGMKKDGLIDSVDGCVRSADTVPDVVTQGGA